MSSRWVRLLRRAAPLWAGVASIVFWGAAAAQIPSAAPHGTWWNPSQPGTGLFFESQGDQAIATFFVYDEEGKPVWYSAPGTIKSTGPGTARFDGTLLQFTDGPAINDADSVRQPVAQSLGTVAIGFQTDHAQVVLPGGHTFTVGKYPTRPPALRPGATGAIPETGIYWDPKGSGRGFTMEADGDVVTIGMYAFTNGYPTWRLAVVPLEGGPVTVRPTVFANGQTLYGSYKAPTGTPAPTAFDDIVVAFEGPCFAALSANGTLPLERFAFGGTACRHADKTPPSPRRMLAPEVPGDTPLTLQQVRKLAARVTFFTSNLPFHDQQAHRAVNYGRQISPEGWWKVDCTLEGMLHMQRQDPDNDKLLSAGDVVWFDYETCRAPAAYPEGATTTSSGWMRAAFDRWSGETFIQRLSYYDLNVVNSSGADHWFSGNVQVAGWLGFVATSYTYEGFVQEGLPAGARIAAKSGTARRIGQQNYLETKYEDLDMRLSLEGRTRVKALVRLADPARPVLFDIAGLLADVPQQGAVELLLEPQRPDGYRIVMTPVAGDMYRVDYLRGGSVLSSQMAGRLVLTDEGKP